MQAQGDYSNTVQALNVDSLKVDLVIIQNTCSEKEDSNSKTASSKSVKESSLDSATKDFHAIKYKMSKAKERCMAYFRSLHSHLQVLSKEDLKGTRIKHGFKRAFMSLFGQDDDTFTSTIDTLLKHMGNVKKSVTERTRHQRQYDRRVNKRQMHTQESKIDTGKAVDVNLVVTKSSGTESEVQDDNSRSENDTDVDDADIKPTYDEERMAKVQLTAECNIIATGQQHTEQPEIINEVRVDQYTEKCQVKSPLLNSSPDNKTTEFSNQSLKSGNIFLKKTVAQFQKEFSRMEAHCIALEHKYQNQALKSGQHGYVLNETSNKAKIKKEIDAYETINIELEHSVAKLLIENEHLNKENETVKKHYKDLYDSIKITISKTIKQTTSLLDNNANLKAQIQEKVFAIAALKMNYKKYAFAKPDQVIASSESRNSSKNMSRFSSNDMVHNHYLEEARKKTQERNRNSKSSVMHTASPQNTTKGSKPKPRSNNQTSRSLPVSKSSCVMITTVPIADHSKNSNSFSDSKHFVCSTYHKCVFNTNHDACITKILKEVNFRAKIQSNKTRNSNKPVEQKSHTQKPWKPTGRIFKTVGLRWVPTGKILASCTSKDDSEFTHGSNVDISNIHKCKQTLDLSAADLIVMTSMIEFGSLFSPLFDEYFNGENQVVSKSFVVTIADASDKRQQQPDSTSFTSTLATSVTADGNFDL
ncbi:hypothetical protein Tco_0906426 [Tanacetum coccineum]|uniref:Uncharacterized protein n=1 Tax=Tanacetum coccineum TaxID=301880 RepID=A0ABQ5CGF8_9ASTR